MRRLTLSPQVRHRLNASKLMTCVRAACLCLSCRWRSRSLRRRVRRTSTRTGGATAIRRRGRADGGRPTGPGGAHPAKPPAGQGEPGGPSQARAHRALHARRPLAAGGSVPAPAARPALSRARRQHRQARRRTSRRAPRRPGADQYAATVSLAGLYKIDGRADDAIKTYERAIALKATDPTALLALARLYQDRGDLAAGARALREGAASADGRRPTRSRRSARMMALALDQKDWAAAKAAHRQLVTLEPTSLFVKARARARALQPRRVRAGRGRAQGSRRGGARATTARSRRR